MKRCPHCRHLLTYGTFVMRYGSDTLVKHPPAGHRREHVCGHCHRKIWIHYNPTVFQNAIFQFGMLAFVTAALAAMLAIRPLFQLDSIQTLLSMIILLFFLAPFLLSYAKYQSAVLKEEK